VLAAALALAAPALALPPRVDGRAYFVSSSGVSSSQIIDNAPGWALCVSGTAVPFRAVKGIQRYSPPSAATR